MAGTAPDGCAALGQGVWAVPDVPGFAAGVARVVEFAARGEGELMVLEQPGGSEAGRGLLGSLVHR